MKKISLAIITLIIVGLFIPAVSADIIYDERITELTDFSESNKKIYWISTSGSLENRNLDSLSINNIEYYSYWSYIALEVPGNRGKWSSDGSYIESGEYPITVNYEGTDIRANLYVTRYTDLLGNIEKTRFLVLFDNWDNKGLSGTKSITFPFIYYDGYTFHNGASEGRIHTAENGVRRWPCGDGIWYFSANGQEWENYLTVSNDSVGYSINLLRELQGKVNPSILYLTKNDNIIYTNNEIKNISAWFAYNDIDKIILNSSAKSYQYSLDGGDPDEPADPVTADVTVYVKNSQTGALIANTNIVIDALVDGEYYQVVNRTEPSGIFSINLQPTGGGQPNPDGYRLIVTADGYNNPMPEINFTVDDYKLSIYCLLDPIAGGPVNENKTFIDFFVRDMSSNPISGATVKFGKYTLITNSAGYTVFEVDKNTNYSWTVSKSGYGALTGNAVIGNDPRHTINTCLAPIVTPTTTTPIPTSPPIGPTPTMTAPTGEPVSNWLEWFAAHFGMILGGGVEIGKIFMWLCFTVPVGVYVGKEAKAGAAGFMAGAGIVTLFFVLIGWVPIWLVVLLALIIGLLYAKAFNSQDNGGGR